MSKFDPLLLFATRSSRGGFATNPCYNHCLALILSENRSNRAFDQSIALIARPDSSKQVAAWRRGLGTKAMLMSDIYGLAYA